MRIEIYGCSSGTLRQITYANTYVTCSRMYLQYIELLKSVDSINVAKYLATLLTVPFHQVYCLSSDLIFAFAGRLS